MTTTTDSAGRRPFALACGAVALCVLVLSVLLAGAAPESARGPLSGWSLVVAGLLACASGVRAVVISSGGRRVSWALLTMAGLVAVAGNLAWTGSRDLSAQAPSALANAGIALALLLAIAAVLSFPVMKPRGAELGLMALDGLIIGSAVMTVASLFVYANELDPTEGDLATRVSTLAFPVLDVVLVTVAAMLVTRTPSDSVVLVLVGCGFVLYAASDLAFAAEVAQDSFALGTPRDLGWIAGYLLLGLAAWHPTAAGVQPTEETGPRSPELRYTVTVFGVLVLAVVVRVAAGAPLTVPQKALWLVLVCAAGARQVLLAVDNARLRRGLERRVAEQTVDLRRLARQTEVLLTSVGDGIYGVDLDGRITFINPSAAETLGFRAEELRGRRAHQEFHAPREDGTPVPWTDCYVTRAIRQGIVCSSEEDVYVRKDGSTLPVEITSSPIVDEDQLTGAVVVFRDVTQRREVDRMKNEFLSVVSHELRTPLTSIRGALGLLSGGAAGRLTPSGERMTTIALESTERLTRLINDILDVERLQSGALPMRVAAHRVDELLGSAATELAESARSAGVRVEVGPADGCVLADRDRVIQALTNLIGNALKFSGTGGAVRLDAVDAGSEVVLRVSDTGRGIPADKLESIFERFQQVDSSDARLEGGTGLGLAISRGIAESLGGRIWAESVLGSGTTMNLALPAAPAAAPSPSPSPLSVRA